MASPEVEKVSDRGTIGPRKNFNSQKIFSNEEENCYNLDRMENSLKLNSNHDQIDLWINVLN